MAEMVRYKLELNSELSRDEIAMLELAGSMPYVEDEDNPEIDPIKTPDLYAAMIKAVEERNRKIESKLA